MQISRKVFARLKKECEVKKDSNGFENNEKLEGPFAQVMMHCNKNILKHHVYIQK